MGALFHLLVPEFLRFQIRDPTSMVSRCKSEKGMGKWKKASLYIVSPIKISRLTQDPRYTSRSPRGPVTQTPLIYPVSRLHGRPSASGGVLVVVGWASTPGRASSTPEAAAEPAEELQLTGEQQPAPAAPPSRHAAAQGDSW